MILVGDHVGHLLGAAILGSVVLVVLLMLFILAVEYPVFLGVFVSTPIGTRVMVNTLRMEIVRDLRTELLNESVVTQGVYRTLLELTAS